MSAEFTEHENKERSLLIDKELEGTLTKEEEKRLNELQQKMLDFRKQKAPLPIEDLRGLRNKLPTQSSSFIKK